MGSGEVEGTSFSFCTMGLGWQWVLCCISPHCWGLAPHPGGPGNTGEAGDMVVYLGVLLAGGLS